MDPLKFYFILAGKDAGLFASDLSLSDSLVDDRDRRGAASIASRPRLRSAASDERSESDVPDEMARARSFSLTYSSMRRAGNQGSPAQSPW